MCGITGWVNNEIDLLKYKSRLKKMTRSLKKRGPDDKGYFVSKHVLLGHRRLSIIDLKTGHQPMTYHGYTIVYNGELYNTLEIKEILIKQGFEFKTTSDTEVLLKGYVAYKEKILDYLDGIFAFAIYHDNQVFIARDRVGVKPLYYASLNKNLLFSSNIKALFLSKIVKPIVDKSGLQILLGLSPSNPPGKTIYRDVKELKPGHYLIYKDGEININRYWQLTNKPCNDSYQQAKNKVATLVKNAIIKQTVSDVSFATFLSGGVDSSIITGVCANYLRNNNKQLSTYAVDYQDNKTYFKKNDYQVATDNHYIKLVKYQFNTKHQTYTINNKTLVKMLKQAIVARDMPGMVDIDASLLWFAKKISHQYKVVLSGECADEIFGGYPWFYKKELLSLDGFPWIRSIEAREQLLTSKLKDKLDLRSFVDNEYQKAIEEYPALDQISKLFYLNLTWFMPTLLTRKDRMTAFASIEARVPFADHHLIEYLWNLPFSYKYHHNIEKYILRDAFKDLLPNEVLYRKKNPYPKTYHPEYTDRVSKLLTKSLRNQKSILHQLFDSHELKKLIDSKGSSFKVPWFGQLMTGPQLIAFLYQIDLWAKIYKVKLMI